MPWIGPFTIRSLLEGSLDEAQPRPPERDGVYVVSLKPWSGEPSKDAGILYVGGNTGKSARFRTRMGDLLADMFGFFGDQTGHHSGGQELRRYCIEKKVDPMKLWIGWKTEVACGSCAEVELYDLLRPERNRKRPPACRGHRAAGA